MSERDVRKTLLKCIHIWSVWFFLSEYVGFCCYSVQHANIFNDSMVWMGRRRERQRNLHANSKHKKHRKNRFHSSHSICENGKYQFVYEAYCKVNALNMRWKRTNATANQTKRINLIKITLHICAYLSTLFHMSFTLLTTSPPPAPTPYYYSLSSRHFSVFTSTILIKHKHTHTHMA